MFVCPYVVTWPSSAAIKRISQVWIALAKRARNVGRQHSSSTAPGLNSRAQRSSQLIKHHTAAEHRISSTASHHAAAEQHETRHSPHRLSSPTKRRLALHGVLCPLRWVRSCPPAVAACGAWSGGRRRLPSGCQLFLPASGRLLRSGVRAAPRMRLFRPLCAPRQEHLKKISPIADNDEARLVYKVVVCSCTYTVREPESVRLFLARTQSRPIILFLLLRRSASVASDGSLSCPRWPARAVGDYGLLLVWRLMIVESRPSESRTSVVYREDRPWLSVWLRGAGAQTIRLSRSCPLVPACQRALYDEVSLSGELAVFFRNVHRTSFLPFSSTL
ncbi:unnamed protein product [Trichogramma brassicae]|uniref:Uncharacterized protein n=1 Tax=Trichogramma brassicae TaxID=86971 RepID=A0A6H5HXB8_9HYME|nr:unnamed protein product [Trichogramma brassicae]